MPRITLRCIGLAKEVESPENPGGLEKRVALVPSDLRKLVNVGCDIFVESGAGEAVGFPDSLYEEAGAKIQTAAQIYEQKDLIIKLKGPSLDAVRQMSPGTILFCMAHFDSFPDRAKLLIERGIHVIAMEEILECPKFFSDEIILSKAAIQVTLNESGLIPSKTDVNVMGYSSRLVGGIRRLGNRNPKSLTLCQPDLPMAQLGQLNKPNAFVYDGEESLSQELLSFMRNRSSICLDLREFEKARGSEIISSYRESHPEFHFGLRRIQCLHETGRAGARYGMQLLTKISKKIGNPKEVRAVVLGYGNVGMGAIHECFKMGIPTIQILGRTHTKKGAIEQFLSKADLIINGAEQPLEMRGKNFLISREQAREVIQDGSVVIDLVGGSASNRSPVENVIECTYLTDPFFLEDGVYFSALWGWPMMGFMRETAIRYSSQILDVLLEREKLLLGMERLTPGIQRAMVTNRS
jgi:alanine dehydrogenase